MGLDMYLAVTGEGVEDPRTQEHLRAMLDRVGLLRRWNHSGEVEALGEYADGKELPDVYPVVAYWRKANAIHAWFVRTQANGVDDCRPVPVSREVLTQLLDTCLSVLDAGKTPELMEVAARDFGLESQAGFFFGSTDYGEWYRQDLEDTCQQVEKILAADLPEGITFFYEASW